MPAHVTLFHHLPGAEAAAIGRHLAALCQAQPVTPFATTGLRFLGQGSAYVLDMPEIAAIRRRLAAEWQDGLTPQDRQGWAPHVTVQNKAAPDEARRVYQSLQAGFTGWTGMVTGLTLWRYLGGPWRLAARYHFTGDRPS